MPIAPSAMRFLLLSQYYPPEVGAAQLRLSAVVRELTRAGHEVEVVTALPNYPSGRLAPADRGRFSRREVIDGIRVRRFWLYPATGAGLRRIVSYLSFMLTGTVGGLRAERPDVVIVESPPLFLGIAGWIVSRRFGASFILNVSDLWPDSVRELGFMRKGPWLGLAYRLERWLYQRADAVTAVTRGIEDELIRKGVPVDRVLFLPNGVDLDAFKPAVRPGEAPRPTITYIGTHGFIHGLDVVLDAAERVPEADFVLIGDGSEKPRLVAQAERRGIENLRFEAPIPASEVPGRYAEATAGLSTLRDTPLSLMIRPAKVFAIMACARPVIYAGHGEGADLVRNASAGIVVPPEDPERLAEAVRMIIADPMRAAETGANGRRFVAELAWDKIVPAWLADLGQRIGPGPGR